MVSSVENAIKRYNTNMMLLHAAKDGDDSKIPSLFASGADVNAEDDDGCTPLHWAGAKGHVAVAETLLARGADVNAKDDRGRTPLHQACLWGRATVAQALLANGADVGAKNNDGKTPRDLATSRGHVEVIVVLDKAQAIEADQYLSVADSENEIETWLSKFLPRLRKEDVLNYRNILREKGFDSNEMLDLLEESDLQFMRDGHKRMLAKKLSESRAAPGPKPGPAGGPPPASEQLTPAMLASATPGFRKNMIGERLHPLIHRTQPELAGKITDMLLLGMDNPELLSLLQSPEALDAKIQEALRVLEAHNASSDK